jgi:iron(III) transport system ATP-binding protein
VSALGIRLQGLTKRFGHRVQGVVHAARDVTLDVRPGEFLTLLGPSGCGKTTTLRMVAGFETPDAGRVWIGDDDVTQVAVNRRGIGFVFQNYALFPHLTVYDNVAYGLRVQGQGTSEAERAVTQVLELVGLRGYERQLPNQLSGGEQQRVALARAIVVRPRVLLFDEPLSNLDARLRVRMRDEIRALQQELAITAIYVTHDQEEAMAVSDRIAVMDGGEIVQEGTAEDLYHRPRTEFVARFVGRVNLLAARVVGPAGTRLTVELGGVQLALTAAGRPASPGSPPAPESAGPILEPGRPVRLVVRPEVIGLVPVGSGTSVGAPDRLDGVVAARTFLGEKVEYQVRVGDPTASVASSLPLIHVTRYGEGGDEPIRVGQPVRLVFPETGVTVLPEPDAS